MSQKNNFGSGFVLGSILGGVVGGVLGTLLTTREENSTNSTKKEPKQSIDQGEPPLDLSSEESMEVARHSLEAKIAQLNSAIDEVRQQLGAVNNSTAEGERLN